MADAAEAPVGFDLSGRPWCGGLWNGYVASGASRDERRSRLAEVPVGHLAGVRSHLATVARLRARAAARRARADSIMAP